MTTRDTGRWTARSAELFAGCFPRLLAARGAAAIGIVAAVAAGGSGSLLVVRPAHAATAEADVEVKVGDNVQGKAGAKVAVGYQVTNHGKIDVGVTVTIQAPSNAEIDSAGGCAIAGNRRAASCQVAAIKAGAAVNGSFQLLLRTAGEANGGITARLNPNQKVNDPKPANNSAGFKVRIAGASATPSASKSTRASRSASADPTGAGSDEGDLAPPEAGNGAVPREDPKTPATKASSGLSFGFWVGVVAIVAALGLVGSLFYFRRKDRLEPDTGVFNLPAAGQDQHTAVITPGVYGSPAAAPGAYPPGGFQNGPGYGQGFPPGQGAPGGSNVYGGPAAGPPPAAPPQDSPPPAGPPQAPSPGANDQTILMRRPDDL